MQSGRWAGLILVAAVGLLGAPAGAAIESPAVRAGVAAFEALDYSRAVWLLDRARGESLTTEELTATLATLGRARVALGDDDGAGRDFEALVRLAPGFALERGASPRIRLVFEAARARVAAEPARAPTSASPTAAPAAPAARAPSPAAVDPVAVPPERAAPATVEVRSEPAALVGGRAATLVLEAPPGTARLELSTRRGGTGGGDFRTRTVFPTGEPALRAQLDPAELAPPSLQLFAVALSPAGAIVGQAGTPLAPVELPVAAAPTPLHRKGWLWGTLAAVVLAGSAAAVAAAVATRSTTLTIVPVGL